MKLLKLSIATLLAISTASYASDNLEEAFKNGNFNGALKFAYMMGNNSDIAAIGQLHNNSNVGSVALEMNYITGDFYGLKLGFGAQSGHDLDIHKAGTNEDDMRNSISATLLHRAFLDYSFSKSNLRVGRQALSSPLIMTDDITFPMIDSFDGVTLNLKELPQTLVKVFYIKNWNKPYGSDSTGSAIEEDVHYKDGAYSIYLKNNSVKNLTLDTQYLKVNQEGNNGDIPVMTTDSYDEYFVRANYKMATKLPLVLGTVYGQANFEQGVDETSFYGIKIGTKINDINFAVAYTSVDDKRSYPGVLGEVPDTLLYTNMLLNKAIYAGVDAFSAQAMYKFTKNLTTAVKVGYFSQSNEGMANAGAQKIDGASEVDFDIRYAFTGALKGLGTRVLIGYSKYDENVNEDTSAYGRLYLTYSF